MSMSDRILPHLYNGDSSDLKEFIQSQLPFKIVVADYAYVEEYRAIFEQGKAEYNYAVDMLLGNRNIGDSEMTTAIRDSYWLSILDVLLKSIDGSSRVILNQHDISSLPGKRPDAVIMYNNAHILKNEAKATLEKMNDADINCHLSIKYANQAFLTFPRNRSVIGILSCPQSIILKEIRYDFSKQEYTEHVLVSFCMDNLDTRVKFIVTIFNIIRYLLSVTGPVENFHLVPNVPITTANGHTVVWEKDGLRKSLSRSHDGEELLAKIYSNKLPNVEWGELERNNKILITRIGYTLSTALHHGRITVEKAISDVLAGMKQMHDLGIAHTDLKMDNVFVDANGAFLDDLEYITDVNKIMCQPYRVLSELGHEDSLTAKELDMLQMELLVRNISLYRR
jgi:hypothetical protein